MDLSRLKDVLTKEDVGLVRRLLQRLAARLYKLLPQRVRDAINDSLA